MQIKTYQESEVKDLIRAPIDWLSCGRKVQNAKVKLLSYFLNFNNILWKKHKVKNTKSTLIQMYNV